MHHIQIGPRHLTPEPPDRPQNLLVNPPVEPQLGTVAEELHVIDHGDLRVAIPFLPPPGQCTCITYASTAGLF